jgi:hypothetical protein
MLGQCGVTFDESSRCPEISATSLLHNGTSRWHMLAAGQHQEPATTSQIMIHASLHRGHISRMLTYWYIAVKVRHRQKGVNPHQHRAPACEVFPFGLASVGDPYQGIRWEWRRNKMTMIEEGKRETASKNFSPRVAKQDLVVLEPNHTGWGTAPRVRLNVTRVCSYIITNCSHGCARLGQSLVHYGGDLPSRFLEPSKVTKLPARGIQHAEFQNEDIMT